MFLHAQHRAACALAQSSFRKRRLVCRERHPAPLRRARPSRYCARVRPLKASTLVAAAWIGPAVLGAVNEYAQRALSGDTPPRLAALIFAGGDWLLYALFTPIVFVLSHRWPLTRPHIVRNGTIHLAMSLFFCAAWAAVGVLLRKWLIPETIWGGGLSGHFVSWLFITLPFGVSVYLAVVGIEHAVRYYDETRAREMQMARLAEQLAGAQLAALQAQFNPHFLFNTLNTIAVLVRDNDREAATRIVEHLSEVLRRTLARHRANEVTLDEELELVRQYAAIEQARFPDRLRVTYDVDPSVLGAAVPGFAIQHLVENAIRHGIARSTSGGLVSVDVRRVGDGLHVTVTDDGPGIDAGSPGDGNVRGHGLDLTRERLRVLYGDRASLTVSRGPGGGTIATLRIPYRTL